MTESAGAHHPFRGPAEPNAPERDRDHAPAESHLEDRERYRELLEELRTIIPGAQVLLAFLLTVPFSRRFEQVDWLGLVIFTVSLLCVASATVLFLAPAAYHRTTNHGDRRRRLRYGVRTTILGLLLLGVAVTLGVFVVVRFVFGTGLGVLAAASIACLAATLWLLVPLIEGRRARRRRHTGRPQHTAT